MDNTTDIILEYNGNKFPFGIQPRCRVGRMIEVVGQGLGIEIEKIIHYQDKALTKPQELTDPNKYLLEDYGITAGQRIIIIGNQIKTSKFDNAITITLKYKDTVMSCQIFNHTTVKHIRDIIQQNMDIVPDSIRLKYNDQYLDNYSKKLIDDLNMKVNDTVDIEGKYFPISLFPTLTFANNLGLHLAEECCICLEKIKELHLFDCGHGNVCVECFKKYNQKNCPLCYHQ